MNEFILSLFLVYTQHAQSKDRCNFKSWTFCPGQYSDLSEGSTKTEQLKVGSLII